LAFTQARRRCRHWRTAAMTRWSTAFQTATVAFHKVVYSVATYVRYGGMYTKRCIANFLLSLSVKEFLKSVKIWPSYCHRLGAWFLEHGVPKKFTSM